MKKNLYGIEAEITKKRVKNVSIRVNETGDVFLTVPYGISEEKACEFFKSKIEWIKRAVEKTENYRKTDFSDGGELFVFGQKRRLEVVKGSREQVICGDDIMTVVVKNEERTKAATIKYLEKSLEEVLVGYFKKWEEITGLKSSEVKIRKMKSLWGSCTPKTRAIRISFYLVSMPARCIEYVVLHELIHIRYPNHQQGFKGMLSEYMPDWKTRRQYLKENGVKMRINL